MTPPRDEHVIDIAVVGGGLSGLALALSLAKAGGLAKTGLNITLFDRGDASSDSIRTTTINASSYDFLEELGVIEGLTPLTPVHKIQVSAEPQKNAKGTSKIDDSLMQWQSDEHNPEPLAWVFRNHHLEKILHQACQNHANITMVSKTTIADFSRQHPQFGDTAAALYTDDGTIHAARLVVAADGSSSPLRQAAGLRSLSRSPKQTALVADIRTSLPHSNMAWQRFLKGGPIALMPLDDTNLMTLVWTMGNDDASDKIALSDDDFNHALMENFGTGFGELKLASPRLSWALKLTHAITPSSSRLVLAGDAAHSIHPLAGQGYNLALGDTRCLMNLISEAQKNGSDLGGRAVTRAYARQRFAETAGMTLATDGLNAVFSFGGKNLVAATSVGMTLVNATPFKSVLQRLASHGLRRFG